MAPRYDKVTGFEYQSGVTSVDPSVYPELRNISRRRMADFIQDSLANRLQVYVKKIMSATNKNACVGEITAFLESLKRDERIADYSVDPKNGNTPEKLAQGIFTILVSVRLLASMDAIVLNTEIGETVNITTAS
jgi:phage tail sheath protein FI